MLNQQTISTLYGKPLIKPGAIESELDKIRSAAATQDAANEAHTTGSAGPRAKATLSNLIVLNTGPGKTDVDAAVDSLINELCISHPSRFFIVDCNLANAQDQSGIAAAVSSRCLLADSGTHICSEEIYISVSENGVPVVSNLLISLLAPDVDVVLVVFGDPADERCENNTAISKILHAIIKIADRVIYDSEGCGSYAKGIRTLTSAAVGATASKDSRAFAQLAGKLSDVNWRRTKRWRGLIAEGFDAERLVASAPVVHRIALFCNQSVADMQRGCIPAEALILAGWILSSLGLTPEKGSVAHTVQGVALNCTDGKHSAQLEFSSHAQGQSQEVGIATVEILAETEDWSAKLGLTRNHHQGTAEVSIGFTDKGQHAAGSCEFAVRNAPFPVETLDECVRWSVVSRREDELYLASMEQSLRIAELVS
ncbi:MAG: glucose-6-phosphate dehydrogenase assembly protein OpcA [Bdellovibrionota bacterium]